MSSYVNKSEGSTTQCQQKTSPVIEECYSLASNSFVFTRPHIRMYAQRQLSNSASCIILSTQRSLPVHCLIRFRFRFRFHLPLLLLIVFHFPFLFRKKKILRTRCTARIDKTFRTKGIPLPRPAPHNCPISFSFLVWHDHGH